ncbi:ABC transporter ATP-binding protein [Methanobrevibacter filiformis]|uniref:Molybdate/tungstate import ATP-binding protein WtpC n=1 Tax=Methanobrevibacter filiformis TaxID=55758 RepID=A0A165ZA31_9EURY|nr:ABC transporter ATP-binding protein [Methanobrevibacter filiformis]KZX10459.1 bicarbonate transport ATP-binding protein CmpD [Methanobrevibacter filiformis]
MSIKIKNLNKTFKTHEKDLIALDNINLEINTGELVCILGPSGCGKTTLLRIIGGLEEHDSGEILEEGVAITKPSRERGFVFQQYSLFPWLNVLDNVMFGLNLAGSQKEESIKRAKNYLKAVGLEDAEKLYPHELSGGMKQRVAIIRSLVNKTKTLLMDEPFSALDMQNRHKLQEELIRIWKKAGRTIIFVTHDVDEATFLADRIILMGKNPGHIKQVFDNTLTRPRKRESEDFLDIQNKIIDILDNK